MNIVLVLLNLTAPPVLLIFLPAAILGNVTLPAPPMSEVTAFNHMGEPLPTWVINNTLYVLQAGDPAVVVYIPRYENLTYFKTIVKAPYIIIQAPPGVMVEQITPLPERFEMNKSGIYLHFRESVEVVYYPFEIKPTPPPPSPTPTPQPSPTPPATPTPPAIPQPIPLPYTQTPPERRQPVLELVLSIAVAAGALAYVFWRSKRRRVGAGGCRDLNEVDLTILKKIYESGGSVERAALQSALAIPKTTLHRHLHKLARYGYIRLIQEGQRQKIELLKMC